MGGAMRDGFRRWLISTTALASMVLVSDTARAQFIGPMTVTSTQTVNNNATVDSTKGSFIVHTTGNGQTGFNIIGGAAFTILPSTSGTFIPPRVRTPPRLPFRLLFTLCRCKTYSLRPSARGRTEYYSQDKATTSPRP